MSEQQQLEEEFEQERLKLLQQRLVIETSNLQLQRELFSKEKHEYDAQSQHEIHQLQKLQELYQSLLHAPPSFTLPAIAPPRP